MWVKNFLGKGSGRYKGPGAKVDPLCSKKKKQRGQYGLSGEWDSDGRYLRGERADNGQPVAIVMAWFLLCKRWRNIRVSSAEE